MNIYGFTFFIGFQNFKLTVDFINAAYRNGDCHIIIFCIQLHFVPNPQRIQSCISAFNQNALSIGIGKNPFYKRNRFLPAKKSVHRNIHLGQKNHIIPHMSGIL